MFIKEAINTLLINKNKTNFYQGIDFIVFIASIFILPISIKWSSKLLFVSFALGIIKSVYQKDFEWFKKHRHLIIVYAVFILYIIIQGVAINGFEEFFKRFDKAVAPYLVFLLTPIFFTKTNAIRYVPKALISGLFFLFFLIALMSIIEMKIYNREHILEVFDIHHLYASLYILFASNFLLSNLSKEPSNKKKKKYLICLSILAIFLLIFKSKAAIVIFLVLLFYHFILHGKPKKLRLLGVVIIGVFLFYIFSKYVSDIYIKALNFRIKIWEAAIARILENPVLGYGSLNEYTALNYQHFINADFAYLDSSYNAHNQYLSLLLRFGSIGLLLFITPFLFLIKTIKNTLKKEYIGFLILLGVMSYIESLTNRHHGIVFTATMLYYYNSYKKNEV